METVPSLGIDAILQERDIAKILLLSCLVQYALHIYLRMSQHGFYFTSFYFVGPFLWAVFV